MAARSKQQELERLRAELHAIRDRADLLSPDPPPPSRRPPRPSPPPRPRKPRRPRPWTTAGSPGRAHHPFLWLPLRCPTAAPPRPRRAPTSPMPFPSPPSSVLTTRNVLPKDVPSPRSFVALSAGRKLWWRNVLATWGRSSLRWKQEALGKVETRERGRQKSTSKVATVGRSLANRRATCRKQLVACLALLGPTAAVQAVDDVVMSWPQEMREAYERPSTRAAACGSSASLVCYGGCSAP